MSLGALPGLEGLCLLSYLQGPALFSSSPEANRSTFVSVEFHLASGAHHLNEPPSFGNSRARCSRFANVLSLFPVLYSFISSEYFPYPKHFHFVNVAICWESLD